MNAAQRRADFEAGWRTRRNYRGRPSTLDSELDRELRAHPPRVVGPRGPVSYRLPFVDAIAEIASRQGWPGRAPHLADPPNLCGRHVHAAPGGP